MSALDPGVRDRAWDLWLERYPDDATLPRDFQDQLLDSLEGHRIVLSVLAADLSEPARIAMGAMADQIDAAIREARRVTMAWWGL